MKEGSERAYSVLKENVTDKCQDTQDQMKRKTEEIKTEAVRTESEMTGSSSEQYEAEPLIAETFSTTSIWNNRCTRQ